METKALRGVEIKDASKGEVAVVFATLDVVDKDRDVTRKGAFLDGAPVRISAYNHSSWEGALPVGKGALRVDGDDVILEGRFFLNTTAGRETFETVKAMEELQEWSYGFHVTDSEPGEVDGKSVRVIKGVDVHEVSPVLLGAGVGTRTLAVKQAVDGTNLDRVAEHMKRTFTQSERDDAASSGHAMSDGSYPINNVQDLRNAIRAVGRGGANHNEIRRHIMRRARALNATNLIPDNWSKDGSLMDDGKSAVIPAVKGAIPAHETDTVTRSWNGTATVKALAEDARPSELRTVYAWVDPDGDPESKSSYRFPHHHGVGGPANIKACLQGIATLNGASGDLGIPEADREAVHKHLSAHLLDADRDVPELRTAEAPSGRKRFADEAIEVLAAVSNFIDRASEVVALRARKNRGIAPATADLLSWLEGDLVRLKSLLDTPVEADQPAQPSDDEIASIVAASLARINGI